MQNSSRLCLCLLFLAGPALAAGSKPKISQPPNKGDDLPRLRGAMTPTDAKTKRLPQLDISGTMHIETNRLSWPDPDRLLTLFRRATAAGRTAGSDLGMRWSIGADIGWLEGEPRAGEIIRGTEAMGVEWDVHAHHMPDRAICATAIRRLGGHPNQVASGLLTAELDLLRNPVQGHDGTTWQAEILWGVALRPLHGPGADDNAFGLWRPKSGREHTVHDSAGKLIIVGGGTRRLDDIERFAEQFASAPNGPPVSSATIMVSPRTMTIVGTQDGIEAIERWAQRLGKLPVVHFATIGETAAVWAAAGSVPSRDIRSNEKPQ